MDDDANKTEMPPTAEMGVDLTLATTYLPAVSCLVRLLFYVSMLNILHPGEYVGGFSIVGLLIWVDRIAMQAYQPHVFFNSNDLISAVFFSNVFQLIRQVQTQYEFSFLGIVVNFFWSCMCVLIILEPLRLKKRFEKRAKLYYILPAVITALALACLINVQAQVDQAAVRVARAVSFASVSLVWIFVVALHQANSMEPIKYDSSHVISRFAPILYLPVPLATLFFIAASSAVAWQYRCIFAAQAGGGTDDIEAGAGKTQDVSQPLLANQAAKEEDMPIEEVFRLARMQAYKAV